MGRALIRPAPRYRMHALALLGCAVTSVCQSTLAGPRLQLSPVDSTRQRQTPVPPTVERSLIEAALFWTLRNRLDLAQPLVDKLLDVQTRSPEALAFAMELALRGNHTDIAQQRLSELRRLYPQSPVTAAAARVMQVYGPERDRLAQMRLMERAGRKDAAAALAQELFPDGPPPVGALGVEVAAIMGVAPPHGWQVAPAASASAPLHDAGPSLRWGPLTAPLVITSQAPAVIDRRTGEALQRLDRAHPRGRDAVLAAAVAASATAAAATSTAPAQRTALGAKAPTPSKARQGSPRPFQAREAASLPPVAAASTPQQPDPVETAREQATQSLDAGRLGPALRLLEDALPKAPQDPWLRHQLARLYLRLGQRDAALSVMDEGVKTAPQDEDMRYARALILSAVDDDQGALDDLSRVPPARRSEGMQALWQRSTVRLLIRLGQMAEAEGAAHNDQDLMEDIAWALYRQNHADQAVAVLERALAATAAPSASQWLTLVQMRQLAGQDDQVSQDLVTLLMRADWTPEQERKLQSLVAEDRSRRIRGLMAQGREDEARALAAEELPDSDPRSARRTRARLWMLAGATSQALPLLESAVADTPDDIDLRLDLATALSLEGRTDDSLAQARWLSAHIRADDLDNRLALVRLWQRARAYDEAGAEIRRLLARFPGNDDVLRHAARLARSQGRYTDALGYFESARTALGKQPDEALDANIAELRARGQIYAETAWQPLHKSATSGISTLNGWEAPTVLWWPPTLEGRWFLHLDAVRLDAGTLDTASSDAQQYGRIAGEPLSAHRREGVRAQGANTGWGYQSDDWQWDVGAIGLGMPVTNWVGGVSTRGDLDAAGRWRWGLGLSRRPVTSSLLSYAGAVDPASGRTWGGVVATGTNARVSTDWHRWSVSLSGELADLTGVNVQNNLRTRLRLAADRDVWRTPSHELNLGLALSAWRYQHDLSNYTWGQGGYYSPQSYVSLTLPVAWSGALDGWKWDVRSSVSVSHSRSSNTPYYPTDAALQTQASSTMAATGDSPLFTGGSSTGFGKTFRAVIERDLGTHWSLGARLDIERAAYYAPTTVLLYLRYRFDPVVAPPANRPRTVDTYSSF